ncbi:MAG: hypothetical protein AMXMBFR13_22420 [Phycisphaerae bacterium]
MAREIPTILWPAPECPDCRAAGNRTLHAYKTERPDDDTLLRWMRCEKCGCRFRLLTDRHWRRANIGGHDALLHGGR